ncbi:MAG: patatin-like phospholipase family protein, partial [Dysgonamonadaceae bacterium]
MNIITITLKYLIVSFIIYFFFVTSNKIQAQTNDDELKLGLVLSGGGAKGFAHIGVLKVFEEENIPITLIT